MVRLLLWLCERGESSKLQLLGSCALFTVDVLAAREPALSLQGPAACPVIVLDIWRAGA